MKFTLKGVCEHTGHVTTHKFAEESLYEILQDFRQFLAGCGYILPEGYLEIVNDEPPTEEEVK